MVHGEHIAVDPGLSPSVRVVRARARVRRRVRRSRNVNNQVRPLRVVCHGGVPAVHGDGRGRGAVHRGTVADVSIAAGLVVAVGSHVARARADAGGVLAGSAHGGPRSLPVQRHGHRPARLRPDRRARPTSGAGGGTVLRAGPHEAHLRVRGAGDGRASPRAPRVGRVAMDRVHRSRRGFASRLRLRGVRYRGDGGVVLPDMARGGDAGHARAVVSVRQRFIPRVLGAKLLGDLQFRRQVRAGRGEARRARGILSRARRVHGGGNGRSRRDGRADARGASHRHSGHRARRRAGLHGPGRRRTLADAMAAG